MPTPEQQAAERNVAAQVEQDLKQVGYSVREGQGRGASSGPPRVPDVPTGGVWDAQVNGAAPPDPQPTEGPTMTEGPTIESPWVVETATVQELMKPIVATQTRQALLCGLACGLAALALVVALQARRAAQIASYGPVEGEGEPDPTT